MADDNVVFVECTRRRRSMNSDARHHNRPRRHIVTTHALLCRVQPMMPQMPAVATPSPATAKRVDKPLAELCTHETVSDWVAAGRDERQQVNVVHRSRRDVRDGVGVVEDAPRLHDVHRRPTDEKQDDHDCQHLNAASLCANATST